MTLIVSQHSSTQSGRSFGSKEVVKKLFNSTSALPLKCCGKSVPLLITGQVDIRGVLRRQMNSSSAVSERSHSDGHLPHEIGSAAITDLQLDSLHRIMAVCRCLVD